MIFSWGSKDKSEWRPWFVWYPIWFKVDEKTVFIWLRAVKRRQKMTYYGAAYEIDYN